MDSTVQPRMSLRSRYRPHLITDQQQLVSLLPTPQTPNITTVNESRRPLPANASITASALATVDRTGWNSRVDHALNEIIRGHHGYKPDQSVYGDINRMFDATLCTLILIASGDLNISSEHLLWSEAFLHGIRDRYGKHPPNVRKLLGFIKHIQGMVAAGKNGSMAERCGLFASTYQDALPENVTLTRIKSPTGNATV